MAEKILLIQPRWMTSALARQQVEYWREKFPHTQFTLLADATLGDRGIKHLIFPQRAPLFIARFAFQLRRTRFRRAVVLTDKARGDVGYGEAKFWAFAANARWREFDGRPLTSWHEAKAKRKLALVWAARAATKLHDLRAAPRRVETVVPAQLMKSARTFVYLQHARHQHGLEPGRVVLVGGDWDEETAWRCGWEPVENSQFEAPIDLLLTDLRGLEKRVPRTSPTLKRGGLSCTINLETKILYPKRTMREVENRPTFFDEAARDIWLVNES